MVTDNGSSKEQYYNEYLTRFYTINGWGKGEVCMRRCKIEFRSYIGDKYNNYYEWCV